VLPGLQGATTTPATSTASVAAVAGATSGAGPAPVLPAYQIDPGVDISNPDLDADSDGLTNHFEELLGSNPTLADSDLDGVTDSFETTLGTDPMTMDTDLDGFTDGIEVHLGSNPLTPDSGLIAPLGTAAQPRFDDVLADDHSAGADILEMH
jgi:hypothetical protein